MHRIPEGIERPMTTAMSTQQISVKEQIAQKDKELALLQQEEVKRINDRAIASKQQLVYKKIFYL